MVRVTTIALLCHAQERPSVQHNQLIDNMQALHLILFQMHLFQHMNRPVYMDRWSLLHISTPLEPMSVQNTTASFCGADRGCPESTRPMAGRTLGTVSAAQTSCSAGSYQPGAKHASPAKHSN